MEFKIMTDQDIQLQEELDEQFEVELGYDLNNPPKHTGLFFRGYNYTYFSNGKLETKIGLRLLKRKSCKGCPTCDYIFQEELPNWQGKNSTLTDIKDSCIYEMKLVGGGRSWTDCGYEYDGPELVIDEVKE